MTDHRQRPGLTLLELVVVLVVIALLVAILVPMVLHQREAARRTESKNNLKQIGLALHNYESTFNLFPPGGVFNVEGKAFHGWMTSITPYLEASPWYNRVNFNIPWDDPSQIDHFQPGYGHVFLNPSLSVRCTDEGLMQTHYAVSDLVFSRNSSTAFRDLTNGLSSTLFAGDAKGRFDPFGYPYNWRDVSLGLNASPDGFGCSVREVTQMLMGDGSVREFDHQADGKLFVSLRGVNSKWDEAPADVSKPMEPYRLSPPNICLWADPTTGSSLLGVENESHELVRAWFLNSGWTWHETPPRVWDQQALLLKPYRSLRELNIRDALSDQGLEALKELPSLEFVQMFNSTVTDRGYESLSRCPALKRLELTSPAMGDRGWKALAKAPKLETIKIDFRWRDHVHFSPPAVVEFIDAKPECEVVIWRGIRIDTATIRELAKNRKGWPKYKDDPRSK